MAMRKAFVDWQKFDASSDLENRKEYMVCLPSDDGTAELSYAVYYEKGTVVDVAMDGDKDITGEEPSAEEKLLRILFGNHRAFTVPEDGLYVMTADYGIDEEECNGAFEGCKEQAVCLGNRYGWDGTDGALPAYWAELPLLPDGLRYSGPQRFARRDDDPLKDEYAALYDRVQADPAMKMCYDSMCKMSVPGDGPVDIGAGGAVYSVTPYRIALTAEGVHNVALAITKIEDQAFLDLHEDIESKPVDEARAMLEKFFDDNQIPAAFRWLAIMYAKFVLDDVYDFYYYRDKRLAAGGLRSLNIPAVLQEAWGMSQIAHRFGRYVMVLRIGAPEIILANELRMCVERIVAAKMGQNLVYVLPGFDTLFGVMPDGSRGSAHCEYGDKELYFVPEDDDDGDDGACDCEAEEMPEDFVPCDGCPCQAKPEPVVGVDVPFFAVIPAPNFLMRRCRFVLWDNTDIVYLRNASGEIEQFQDWASAKARSEALASERNAV